MTNISNCEEYPVLMPATVSIIICTCNRVDDLRQTLQAISHLSIPEGFQCDLTVVDNASTDKTSEMVQSFTLGNMPIRYLLEPRPGKGHAYNSGIAATTGDILLFTDDDVWPPADWLQGMCRPIASGQADAVSGGVKLASHLHLPWMQEKHILWLASTETLPEGTIMPLMGANMALSRRVLEQVPRFDIELGPGAKGHGEDTFFYYQLKQAGYRFAMALDTIAEHHVQASRLTRKSYAAMAGKRGEFNAYIQWHWSHLDARYPYWSLLRAFLALWAHRLLHLPEWLTSPTVPAWELGPLETFHTAQYYLLERKLPRKYEKFGLVKLT